MTIIFNPSILDKDGSSTRFEQVGDIIYRGKAAPGSLDSAPVWLVTKQDVTEGGEYPKLHANGRAEFVNVWDHRAMLTYS